MNRTLITLGAVWTILSLACTGFGQTSTRQNAERARQRAARTRTTVSDAGDGQQPAERTEEYRRSQQQVAELKRAHNNLVANLRAIRQTAIKEGARQTVAEINALIDAHHKAFKKTLADLERQKSELLQENEEQQQQHTAPREPHPDGSVDLREAIRQRMVEAEVTGQDLDSVSITLRSREDKHIVVVVAAGMTFKPRTANLQSMMVVRYEEVPLRPSEETSRSIAVACIDMRRKAPGKSDSLEISTNVSGDLSKLVQTEGFRAASFRIRQFAVWTITDNPPLGEYTGIGMFGFGSGPDQQEMVAIGDLLFSAGINPRKYQAFGPFYQPRRRR